MGEARDGDEGEAKMGIPLAIDTNIVQEHPNWCWAACIDVVVRFRQHSAALNQCDVATAALGKACCTAPHPCDVPVTLAQITTLFNGTYHIPATLQVGPLDAATLKADLNANHLVGVYVQRHQSAHIVLVYGYVGNKFHVYDPLGYQGFGPVSIRVLKRYMSGHWTFSWRNL
jgi:hypothetical protein